MKQNITALLVLLSSFLFAQSKLGNSSINKIIEIKNTEFVVGSQETNYKYSSKNNELVFINTKNGEIVRVDFPEYSYIKTIQQIKLDSLNINKVLVITRSTDLNNDKSINWNDPEDIFIFSVDGKQKVKITDNPFFVRTWLINNYTGCIVISGNNDSNKNGKLDKNDLPEIIVYNLQTLKIVKKQ